MILKLWYIWQNNNCMDTRTTTVDLLPDLRTIFPSERSKAV